MNWSVRTVDWVAGAAMVVVLSVGGAFGLGAWSAIPGLTEVERSASKGAPPQIEAAPADEADDEAHERSTPSTPDKPGEPVRATGGESARDTKTRTKPSVRPRDERARLEEIAKSTAAMRVVLPGSAESTTEAATSVEFVVSSLNVLGSSHTQGKGARRGYAAGPTRAGFAAQLVSSHGVDILGLQELQDDQMRTLMDRLPGYGIFPGPSMGWREAENSIMWRSDKWYPVQSSTIAIPYFRGSIRQMPYVRLRSLETGTDIWVANFHNPASTPRWGDNSRWRAEATRRQVALVNELRSRTSLPVIFTGDFNARADYFCPLVAQTPMESPTGGSAENGSCSPPARMDVDWIFGTPEIDWVSSSVDRGPMARRTTDHPMILATGRLTTTGARGVD